MMLSLTAPHGGDTRVSAAEDAHPSSFWALTLGSIGVVYGDIGTSPLYAFREAIVAATGGGEVTRAAVFGVLSLIFWALIIIVTLKYVLLLLRADNNGEGGTLTLMALAQRALGRSTPILFLLGTISGALFYGDAVITPALSVLSAVEGLKIATPAFEPYVVPLTVVILIALFAVQSRGTAQVAALFGPIMLVWFVALAVRRALSDRRDALGAACTQSLARHQLSREPRRDRTRDTRRGLPRRDGCRSALCRSRSFRPPSDSGRLAGTGAAGTGVELSRPGRAGARAIPRRSRTHSFCSIRTGRCCRWWCWRPPRP